MGEKHPDRTNEWQKQQQALKYPKTIKDLTPNDTDNADHNKHN